MGNWMQLYIIIDEKTKGADWGIYFVEWAVATSTTLSFT
jgi:hypothetical protein